MKRDDPKAMLALWCSSRSLPPPAFVACRVASGGVEVVGSITLEEGRYVRACHQAASETDAELEVSRDLFVQVQATAGPIAWPSVVPRRRETKPERLARLDQRRAEREALEREARRRKAFLCITAHGSPGGWAAQGLWQVGHAQMAAGPFEAPTREGAEAKVVAHLLQLCAGG